MPIVTDDELKVVVTLGMPGLTVAQNVYYARYDGLGDVNEATTTNDMKLWSDDMYANMLATLADTVTIEEVTVFRKVTADPLVFEQIGTEASTQVGTSTDQCLPNGVAMVMRVGTVALRSIARKYIPGINEGSSDITTWSAAALAAGASFLFDWLAGPATQAGRDYTVGIVSTKDGLFKTFKGTGILSAIPGYQRRRKPGVGI